MTNLIPVRKWLMLWEHCYCSENNYNIPVNRERWACNRRHALSSRLIVSLSDSWRNPFNDQHCDVRWSAADTIFNVRTCWVTSRLSEFISVDRLWTSSLLVWCNSWLSRTARHYLEMEYSNILLEICSNYFWLLTPPCRGWRPPSCLPWRVWTACPWRGRVPAPPSRCSGSSAGRPCRACWRCRSAWPRDWGGSARTESYPAPLRPLQRIAAAGSSSTWWL